MRKMTCATVLALILALALGGCAEKELDRQSLGWEDDWVAVGDRLAAEPVEGFDSNENLDAMAPSGLWYATWTHGEGEPYVNADGDDATLYEAKIYLLISECKSESAAKAELQVLTERERESYDCGEASAGEYAGQSFDVFTMTSLNAENPYSNGAAAFGTRGKYVITVEFLCREGYDGDPEAVLTDFLDGLHYNDTEG